MINIGIVGYGYWGPNVARNFSLCSGAKLSAICDANEARIKIAKATYPAVKTFADPLELIKSDDIRAVAIVTPVHTHYDLAKAALESGKHVFLEKPMTSSARQAEDLINLARKNGLILMVDHTFLFTGAVKKMREIIESGELGDLFFYDSVRVNLGLFQHDVNVVWDLAPHDFSIMNMLINKNPVAISAHGTGHFDHGREDVAYIYAHFDNGFIAHFHCNWLSPVKIRKTLISGSKKMLVWDDLSSDEKIKIYDRGIQVESPNHIHKLLVSYRSGDMYVPKVAATEALQLEAGYFLECVEAGVDPFNNGEAGLKVVKMLEATDQSLKRGGAQIRI